MQNVYEHIDANQSYFIEKLAEVVAIPSVSGEAKYRPEVVKMGQWLESELVRLGATVSMRDVGTQQLEGKTIALPPVVLASYGGDPKKKTVLVYGHYDVQPAQSQMAGLLIPLLLLRTRKAACLAAVPQMTKDLLFLGSM